MFYNDFTKNIRMITLYKPPTKNPCSNSTRSLNSSGLSIMPRIMKSKIISFLMIMLLSAFYAGSLKAQAQGNEATWNGFGYSLKKVVSNTSIPSGVNFSYTILFTAPAGATTVNIQDQIPSALVVVNVPTPAIVNGVTPVVTTTGAIGSQVVTYSLSSLPPGSPSSGSFTIVVKFPAGTTCNGSTARNRVGIQVNSDWNYTGYVSTSATSVDPWVISKTILSGPVVNPNGGNCGYQMNTGTTVVYRLAIMKANGYWGNDVGQMNMTSASVSDIFPAGAVVGTLPAGVAISLNTITWTPNSGLLDAANAWAYYWVDIPVTYPAGPFPNGSFVYNQATLTGVICQQQASHSTNQTCIEIANVTPHPGGYFQKWVSVQNRVPGCPGSYTIYFCNNGNVPLSAFNITDAIPSGVSVTSVQFYYASPTTTVNITANGGANTIVTGLNTNSWSSGAIGYTVNNLQFSMTGSLPVGQCLYIIVNFTVNANPVGTVVNNCAVFNGLSNGLTLPNTCASFTVAAAQPDPCLVKDICAPQTDYEPGDIIRMRLRVQNIGSAALTGATIQDILNPSFQYLGNESYFKSSLYSPVCGPGIPAGTTAWTGVTPSHSGNNLSWNIPSIPSACQFFAVAYCGYYGTWGLDYYFIEFDVQVSGSALPGVTPNNYSISGGNLPATVTSNTINVLIVASFGQEAEKQVSTDNGVTFASTGTVTPGSTAKYRLNYKNTSNVPVSTVNLVDLLARDDGPANDWLILNRTAPRGSQFEITYAGSPVSSVLPVISPPVPTINFAAGENICLPPWGITLGCLGTTWALSPVTENVRFNNGIFSLPSNSKLRQDFNINIPLNATPQQTVCNDFAAISTANFLLNGNPTAVALTPIAAPPICLTVAAANSCCDSVRVEQYFSAAAPGCCARIRSKCEIKSINISLSNGTFSSASWNCGAIPPAYIGQSSYTFAPGTCAPLDMITCFSQAQPGVVIVTYTINFANGQTCTKVLDVNCNPPHINCCDSVKVESFTDPTVAGCCAKLSSTCEIKAVKITLGNGTFFSAGSNCGPLTPGYFGQSSWTFAPGNCTPVELITCLTPIQPGYVIVNYTVYFANGDSCNKVLDLNCTNVEHDCCDSIRISQVQDIPGVVGCCAKIESKCDVEKVNVAVTNGTISAANWSCGPIPAGYVGSSNYTFVAGGCPIDLTTCFNAIVTGSVGITYTVTLTNGEVCIKFFKLNCTVPEVNCCDSVRVVKYSDTTQAGCCLKLESKCEIKAVKVSLTNGTFSSATSTCATLTPGYVGQSSWTFAPGNCTPVSLITCVNAQQTGIVIANYTIYFANGDSCKKVIDLDCIVPVRCCDSVRVESYSSATAPGCCAKLHSVCEIKAVKITLGNGTFSSASSSCGALTPGYVGQSSWTFAPGNCTPVDLITCFTPKQPGYVVVNYAIYFANGDSCHKVLDLNCSPTFNCCDSIKVSHVQGPNGTVGCCARIKSKCDVQKVNLAITNGTISSASWNCGPIPSGYVGQSNYTFVANGCAMDLTTCFDAIQTGTVSVIYTVTLTDGTVCTKELKFDCTATPHCCDSVKVETVKNPDGTANCCARLKTTCEVETIVVNVTNGTLGTASWNCGPLPNGYVGQSSYTFQPNGCIVDLTTCVDAIQTGVVTVTYSITFKNGETCKKTIDLKCNVSTACCAKVDFKLKQKWPFKNQVGIFNITNLDPSSPICKVQIYSSPTATFTPGSLFVDAVSSPQVWNSTSIPATGTLTSPAVNTISFNMSGNYSGLITICVVKCDGTRCCFDFKWNKSPLTGVLISPNQLSIGDKLVAVSINPSVTNNKESSVKYVSFGFIDPKEVDGSVAEFFAISASQNEGEEYPASLAAPVNAYMSRFSAFFELPQPVRSGNGLGAFNLVFSGKLPKLGCTLFSENGDIVFSGNIDVSVNDSVITSSLQPSTKSANLFEFINVYPNPSSNGLFTLTYATGEKRDVEISVVNAAGQVMKRLTKKNDNPGIHKQDVDTRGYPTGIYKMVISSGGKILSKSAVKN
jgi:uncharacterized repeat protein (TIGR01451 family)